MKPSEAVTSAQAILKGLAPDGGLFVPETIPKLKLEEIERLLVKRYEVRAVDILHRFLTDYSIDELAECAELGYDWFDVPKRSTISILLVDKQHPTPTVEGASIAPDQPVEKRVTALLELWHGPTSAFKDMALQVLPHLMRQYNMRLCHQTGISAALERRHRQSGIGRVRRRTSNEDHGILPRRRGKRSSTAADGDANGFECQRDGGEGQLR